MKKIFAITLAASIVSSAALAEPVGIYVEIECPVAQNQHIRLTNNGDYIGGYGLERIQGQVDSTVYFKSKASIKNVPADLQNYSNAGVKYGSSTGNVTCKYASSAGEASFEIIYTLMNGKAGKASVLRDNVINILLPFGLKK